MVCVSDYTATGVLIDADFDLQEVLALRATAKEELKSGAMQVTQWRSGDTSATRLRELSTLAVIAECKYALAILDPETYGQDIVPPTTRAVFG